MNPKPLVGMLADDVFEHLVQRGRIFLRVTRHLDRRVEAQHVAPFLRRPQREAGNDRRAAARGQPRETRGGAGGNAVTFCRKSI